MKRTRVFVVAAAVCGGFTVALGLAAAFGAVALTTGMAALLFAGIAVTVVLGAAAGISAASR